MKHSVPCLLGLFLLLGTQAILAQYRGEASPLGPSVLQPDPKIWWIGAGLGGSVNSHSGTFTTQICHCSFEGGEGSGFTAHVEAGRRFGVISLSLRASFLDLRATSSSLETRMTVVQGQPDRIPLHYERSLTAGLTYGAVTPAISLYPFEEGLYLSAGATLGFSLSSSYEYTDRLIESDYVFVENDDAIVRVSEDQGDIPDLESLRLGARGALGYDLWLGYRTTLTPEVAVSYPLTDISTQPGWKALGIVMTATLRIWW